MTIRRVMAVLQMVFGIFLLAVGMGALALQTSGGQSTAGASLLVPHCRQSAQVAQRVRELSEDFMTMVRCEDTVDSASQR